MFRIIITVVVFTLISACSMQVYKLNVQQGNIVTQDMLDKLKPGMNKRQVAFIMGNPVMADAFNQRQWNYLYRTERREDQVKQYQIRIFFDQAQKYSHFEGELPSDTKPQLQGKKDKPLKAFTE